MKLRIFLTAIIIFALPLLANSQPADSTIRNVVARIDTANIDNIIKDLSGENPVTIEGKEYIINNRNYKSPLNAIAAKYVYYKFIGYGYNTHFSTTPYPSQNIKVDLETIYSVKIGKTKPNDIVIFAGSHDSRESDSLGPGANENASGLSVVLEASRIFKDVETERTIIFVSFDDWANTGYGTRYLLDSLMQNSLSKLFGIGLDVIGYYGDKPISISSADTNISKGLISSFYKIANLIEYPYPLMSKKLPSTPFYILVQNGYEGIYFVRNFPPPPPYIGKTDVFSNLDLSFLHANARLAIGTLAYVAGVIDGSLPVENEQNVHLEYICPNPANDYINCKQFMGFSFKVFNLLGKCVETGFVNSEAIYFKQLPAGFYYIEFLNGKDIKIKKLIKK
ncbi:MAG: M28 family metallopeptidase [Candidatus Kapaibacteriota bacterium]